MHAANDAFGREALFDDWERRGVLFTATAGVVGVG